MRLLCIWFRQWKRAPKTVARQFGVVASENETRLWQRTAMIRREQTATNVFENSNYLNVLGSKHLVCTENLI
jgi:hypothetical protein